MVAAEKPTPVPPRARLPGRPLDIAEANWSEAVRREATVRVLAASGANSRSVVDAAAASLGISPALFRHRHLPAERLIITLANAIDTASDQDRDIVLPELSTAPTVPAPVNPATPSRTGRARRSRGV
jgi:hypothetical protein